MTEGELAGTFMRTLQREPYLWHLLSVSRLASALHVYLHFTHITCAHMSSLGDE